MEIAVVFAEIICDPNRREKSGKIVTQNLIRDALTLLTKTTNEHGGKTVKTTEDQILCVFPAAKKAIQSACQMQQAIFQSPEFGKLEMALKIGAHYGEGALSKNTVSGEALSIAKKLRDTAQSGQIIITREMQKEIPAVLGLEMKHCGKVKVEEKLMKIDLFEVFWNEGEEEHTIISKSAIKRGTKDSGVLTLEYLGKSYELGKSRNSFLLGRGNKNDMIIDEPCVSRDHARIKLADGAFKLIDQSTNGTYLNTSRHNDFCLHKAEFVLESAGFICLGKKIDINYPHLIRFGMEDD